MTKLETTNNYRFFYELGKNKEEKEKLSDKLKSFIGLDDPDYVVTNSHFIEKDGTTFIIVRYDDKKVNSKKPSIQLSLNSEKSANISFSRSFYNFEIDDLENLLETYRSIFLDFLKSKITLFNFNNIYLKENYSPKRKILNQEIIDKRIEHFEQITSNLNLDKKEKELRFKYFEQNIYNSFSNSFSLQFNSNISEHFYPEDSFFYEFFDYVNQFKEISKND